MGTSQFKATLAANQVQMPIVCKETSHALRARVAFIMVMRDQPTSRLFGWLFKPIIRFRFIKHGNSSLTQLKGQLGKTSISMPSRWPAMKRR
jgi:hypothetical protein